MTNINKKHTREVLKKIPSIDELLHRFSNSDISCPETNALPPFPFMPTTRTLLLLLYSDRCCLLKFSRMKYSPNLITEGANKGHVIGDLVLFYS